MCIHIHMSSSSKPKDLLPKSINVVPLFDAPLRWLHIVPSAATCWIVWLCPFERFASRGVLGLESHKIGTAEIAGLSPPHMFLIVHPGKIKGSLQREHEANLISPSMASAKIHSSVFFLAGVEMFQIDRRPFLFGKYG